MLGWHLSLLPGEMKRMIHKEQIWQELRYFVYKVFCRHLEHCRYSPKQSGCYSWGQLRSRRHSRDLGTVVSLLLSHRGNVVVLVLLPRPGSKLAQWKSSFHYPVFSCVQMRVTEKPVEHSERLKHHRVVLCLLCTKEE